MNRRDLLTAAGSAALVAAMAPGIAMAQSDGRDLARVSAYLNSIGTMKGTFTQIDPDGVLSEGRFYLRRPGRIRFEYEEPNPALVVADGFWVGVTDTRLNSLDRYPLSETPLAILLAERVDLANDSTVRGITRSAGQMRVEAHDPDNPDLGSITMVFGQNPLELRQWIVIDETGSVTTVSLGEIQSNVTLDNRLFVIKDRF